MDSYQSFHPRQPMDDGAQNVFKSLSKLLKGICDPNTMGLLEDGDSDHENDWDSVYLRQIVANSPRSSERDWRSKDFGASGQSLVSPHSPKAFAERASIKLDRRNSSPRRRLPQSQVEKQSTPANLDQELEVQKSTPETMASTVHEDDASPESNLTCTPKDSPEPMDSIEDDAKPEVKNIESLPSLNMDSTETTASTNESTSSHPANEKISPFDDDGNIEIVLGSPPSVSRHIEIPEVSSEQTSELNFPAPVSSDENDNIATEIPTTTESTTTESDTETNDAEIEAVIADINAEFVAKVDAAEAAATPKIDDIIEIGMDKVDVGMDDTKVVENTDEQSKTVDSVNAEIAVDAPVDQQTDGDAPVNAEIDLNAQTDGDAVPVDVENDINETAKSNAPSNAAAIDAESNLQIDVTMEVRPDDPAVISSSTDDIITPKRVLFPQTPKEEEEDTIQSEETVPMSNPPKQQIDVERTPAKPLPVEKAKSLVPFRPPASSSIRNVLVATAINTVVNYVVLGAGMYCISLYFGARQVAPTNLRHRK